MFPKHPYLHALLQNIVPWNDQELHGSVTVHIVPQPGVYVVLSLALFIFAARTLAMILHYDWLHTRRR